MLELFLAVSHSYLYTLRLIIRRVCCQVLERSCLVLHCTSRKSVNRNVLIGLISAPSRQICCIIALISVFDKQVFLLVTHNVISRTH